MPCTESSTTSRMVRSGSSISMRTGPQLVSRRSTGIRPDACTLRCIPSVTTLKAASITDRLGYKPMAAAKKTSPSRS